MHANEGENTYKMCEQESDSCSQVDFNCFKPHLSETGLLAGTTNSKCFGESSISSSSDVSHSLAPSAEVTALIRCRGLEERCSCVSRTHLKCITLGTSAEISTCTMSMNQFSGWEHRVLPHANSSHLFISQNSDHSLGSVSTDSNKSALSKTKFNQQVKHRRTDSSKSKARSYAYSDNPSLFEFEHHLGGGSSLDIDKYRRTVTYPRMEQRIAMLSNGQGESTLWSSRCATAPSSTVLKPKQFVLSRAPAALYTKPFPCVKNYSQGHGHYCTSEKPTKFRLSRVAASTYNTHQHQHHSPAQSAPVQLMMKAHRMQYSHRYDPRQFPLSVVGGFSSQQVEQLQNQSTSPAETDQAGAEEGSDVQLSMTWISQPVPESFLVGTVTYTNASQRIPKQRKASLPESRNCPSLGFKGTVNVSSVSSANRTPSSTLLAMANHNRSGQAERLNCNLQLLTRSMPLIKSERALTKTNKLGHLLSQKHKPNVRRAHISGGEANTVSYHGTY